MVNTVVNENASARILMPIADMEPIPDTDVDLFDLAIAIALLRHSRGRLARIEMFLEHKEWLFISNTKNEVPAYFRREDGCLVVSFEQSGYAYLDETHGFHHEQDRCWYVPGNPLMDAVLRALNAQQRTTAGGRAFLHNAGALGADGVHLVRWQLAKPSHYLWNWEPGGR